MSLDILHITKRYGEFTAVDDVSFTVAPGRIFGFLGTNGAGKTTTMRMILDIIRPDSGQITWEGVPISDIPRKEFGYLPEERGLYPKMIVEDQLLFLAQLYGAPRAKAKQELDAWLEFLQITENRRKTVEQLSKGNQQKIQFLAAVLHDPDILILDEPFSGLDPVSTRMLKDLILAENRRGATVLFSTHVMPQAEEICDHVVMIHRGHKVLDDPVRTILRSHDSRALTFEPLDAHVDVAAVRALPEVERCIAANGHYEVALRDGVNATAAMRSVLGVVPAARIELKRRSLEDVFVSIAGTEGGSAREASSKAVAA
jgi:ABC-2 type transport system ATP-binding protein